MSNLFLAEPARPSKDPSKLGILLLNLGSPDYPDTPSLRRYLNEFLSDQRVIELSSFKWQPILKGIILPFRAPKSAKKYQKIWHEDGAPLCVYTAQLAKELQKKWGDTPVVVDFAMTYGQPSIESVTQKMKAQGVDQLFAIPLFPQYAGSSSGAALDALFRTLMKQRNMLDIMSLTRFFNHPAYIQSICKNIQQHWQAHGRSEHLLMSFHGVPVATIEKGDSYFDECQQSAQLIAEELALNKADYTICFQSRFGSDKWIQPSTQVLLKTLPQKGIKSIDIVCPGFVCDCLETLEEIEIEGKKAFEDAGGEIFQYIPCLNTQPYWIDALQKIIASHYFKDAILF